MLQSKLLWRQQLFKAVDGIWAGEAGQVGTVLSHHQEGRCDFLLWAGQKGKVLLL
jgi:hypothetical protein